MNSPGDARQGDAEEQIPKHRRVPRADVDARRHAEHQDERQHLDVVPEDVPAEPVPPPGVVRSYRMLHRLGRAEDEHGARQRVPDVEEESEGATDVRPQRAGDDVVRAARARDLAVGDDRAQRRPGQQRGRGGDQQQQRGVQASRLGRDVRQPQEEYDAEYRLHAWDEDTVHRAEVRRRRRRRLRRGGGGRRWGRCHHHSRVGGDDHGYLILFVRAKQDPIFRPLSRRYQRRFPDDIAGLMLFSLLPSLVLMFRDGGDGDGEKSGEHPRRQIERCER